jgi:nicotinamide-nucleotide amidase
MSTAFAGTGVPLAGLPLTGRTSTPCAILSIGTELTRGEIDNTNASWLAARLVALGLEVVSIEAAPDEAALIAASLERLATLAEVVVCTGGLGPTTDDLTTEVVAAWLGVPVERDEASLAAIVERFTRAGRVMSPSNVKQADFPAGAEILKNPHGTAPGFRVQRGACALFFMPGVPREMKPMFDSFVAPSAARSVRGAFQQVRLRCFGLPESVVNDRLSGLAEQHQVNIAYRAHFPEIEVKLRTKAKTQGKTEAPAPAAADEARQRIGTAVYAEGDTDLPTVVAAHVRNRQTNLALAESCTGGLISSLICKQPASDFYLGGVVSYANSVKHGALQVNTELLTRVGAVSAETAQAMAQGVRALTGAEWGLSVSGIMGPTGATTEKPIGLVFVGVANSAEARAYELRLPEFDRPRLQLLTAWSALRVLGNVLLGEADALGTRRVL